ncbi:MAG: hypothetical protein C5B54_09345 [Acidobacteria bacterium]|nr:MAG: hypothetical protein C5B54_09345 [Acidobacteriota bacterium]
MVLFKTNGHLYAANNRCPHEGYPLAEGTFNPEKCLLTCNWHNWKFEMNTGKNISGEDDLNIYDTKIDDGNVWIHIPEIPKTKIAVRIFEQLRDAFNNQSYDRIVRELTKLHFEGLDLLDGVRKAIEWSYDRLEYGMDHAYAVTADWLVLFNEFPQMEEKLICLAESVDYISESSLRQPEFAYTSRVTSFSKPEFLKSIEEEDEESAVAMVNGALSDGLHFADLEAALSKAALCHYNDFGHSLIYVTKISRLIEILGAESERYLLPSLTRSICYATREDLLPEFRNLQTHIEKWNKPDGSPDEPAELMGRPTESLMEWVSNQAQSENPKRLYEKLVKLSARNLLHYDMSYQFSYSHQVSKNIGWLDFTHALTFGNAVRKQCSKFPELWKYGLLEMACFIGRNHKFLDRTVEESQWIVSDRQQFFEDCINLILDHGKSTPIFPAHYVKTMLAVREELEFAGEDCAKYLLAGLNRFLHSPLKEKHVRRTIRQALSLVGKEYVVSL